MIPAALRRYTELWVPGCAELLSVYMARLEGTPLEGSEETYRTVSGLLALLQAFHADMAPAFRADTLAFFGAMLTQLHDMRWASVQLHIVQPAQPPRNLLLEHSAACLMRLFWQCITTCCQSEQNRTTEQTKKQTYWCFWEFCWWRQLPVAAISNALSAFLVALRLTIGC